MPKDDAGLMTDRQERIWFRVWVLAVVVFFVAAGGALSWFQWHTKKAARREHKQLMNPTAPDPGVTAAAASSTDQATPVTVGMYVERVPELSTRDATWT